MPDGEVSKVECGECGATYDPDMYDCPICGAARSRAGPPEETGPTPSRGGDEAVETSLVPVEEEVPAHAEQGVEGPAVEPEPEKEGALPEVDAEKVREELYRSAFAEVGRDWAEHRSKLTVLRLLTSIEKGLMHASLILVVSVLVIYLMSVFLYVSGATNASFWEIYLEIFSVPYLLLGMAVLLAFLLKMGSSLTTDEDVRKVFLKMQMCALLMFIPPFVFVMNLVTIPTLFGMLTTLIFLGIGALLLWRFLLRSTRDFPLWFSMWLAGLWLFLSVHAGVIFRNMLLSGGSIPVLPVNYGYYLHYGPFDVYVMLLSSVMVCLAYLNIRPMYRTQESFESNVRYAIEFYLGKSYDASLSYFNRGIRVGEDIMRKRWRILDMDIAWMGRGACEIEKGKYDDAVSSLRMALKLNPANPTAWNLLGISLMRKDDLDGAVDALRRSVEIDPKYAEAYNNLGNAMYLRERFKEALRYYDAALDINRRYRDAWVNKGYTYLRLGLHKDAIRCSNEAMKLEKGAAYG